MFRHQNIAFSMGFCAANELDGVKLRLNILLSIVFFD